MKCKECIEFIQEYLEGTLDPEMKSVFEDHIKWCQDCLHFLHSYKTTVDLCKDAYSKECAGGDGELPESLVRAILKAKEQAGKHAGGEGAQTA